MDINPKNENPLVVVAMSGGVDSSLAAFLLNQRGYQVVGMSMKLWDFKEVGGNPHPDGRCCSVEALNDARAVCQKMGVPHYVVDLREVFKRDVISNFVEEYIKGRTPNPCIICNTKIKWESLWKKAESVGAGFIATGHYARIEYDQKLERFLLRKGIDSTRDQSYTLWGLSQNALSRTIFPLGELTKKQVRALAKEYGLKVAEKEESQEICFVADDDYSRFIKEWLENQVPVTSCQLPESRVQDQGSGVKSQEISDQCPVPSFQRKPIIIQSGPILNLKGEKIGEHRGIPFYTIGQRKGLKIAIGRPLYVVRIDAEKNAIYVGENDDLFKSSFVVTKLNWIAFDKLDKEIDCEIKIRYQHVPQKGRIYPLTEENVMVKFNNPERAITPGQSAVFYQGEVVLGGGVIDRAVNG